MFVHLTSPWRKKFDEHSLAASHGVPILGRQLRGPSEGRDALRQLLQDKLVRESLDHPSALPLWWYLSGVAARSVSSNAPALPLAPASADGHPAS